MDFEHCAIVSQDSKIFGQNPLVPDIEMSIKILLQYIFCFFSWSTSNFYCLSLPRFCSKKPDSSITNAIHLPFKGMVYINMVILGMASGIGFYQKKYLHKTPIPPRPRLCRRVGRHLAFDGRFLHGAFDAAPSGPRSAVVTNERVTFLVSWLPTIITMGVCLKVG